MSSQDLSPKLRVAVGLVKIAAIVAGFVASAVSIMAAVGAYTDNIYARAGAALAGTIIVPLAVADRLLPRDDPRRARGLVGDVFAVMLLGFALLFTAAGNKATRPLLAREGDRLVRAGWDGLARVAYVLASVDVTWPPPAPAPEPATSSATRAAPDAGPPPDAGPTDAGAAEDAAASDAGDAGASPDAGDAGARNDRTPAELFQSLSPSVVTIFVRGKELGSGSGTGFVVDEEGTIVTNHHVIKGAEAVRIKFKNGAVYEQVDLLADAAETDLALLRIDMQKPTSDAGVPEAPPLVLGDSEKVVVGERAVSIGNPLGLEHTLTDGLVSSRRVYEGRDWIQMSVPISPGNSGGPLFNMRGEVIGISTATLSGAFAAAQNLNLAVPVNELKRLIRPSYASRRRIGDQGATPSQW